MEEAKAEPRYSWRVSKQAKGRRPAMATGTVKESEEKRKREETLAEARRELREAMARYARAELACCGAGSRHESLLDRRLRAEALELARQGLELAYGKDDAAPGRCPDCGGRTRLLRVEKPRASGDLALRRHHR